MPFFGDTLGAYMLPRVVLELLQQPGGQEQCGVCGDSGLAWLLSGQNLYVWRYREGKEARLRVLALPRQPAHPCAVMLLADSHSPAAASSSVSPAALGGLMTPPATAITPPGPATGDGSLTVAVCDANGRLTVWLDSHHLAAPVEHQLLTSRSHAAAAAAAAASHCPPLVAAFTAARVDLGAGPAFLAALSAADGSLHLVQVGSQGIFSKQLVAAPAPVTESRGLVGVLGSALSRALTDAFEPSSRYMRRTPAARPAVALHLAPSAGGGGQHYRLLVLAQDCLDCWAISVGLRPSEALQWSFANCLVRQHDTRRSPGVPVNLDMAVGQGSGGQHVAVWMAEVVGQTGPHGTAGRGEVEELGQHVVQLLELHHEGGPAVCSGVHDVVRGYEELADDCSTPFRRLLYSSRSHTCLLARWQQAQRTSAGLHPHAHQSTAPETGAAKTCRALWTWDAASGAASSLSDDPDTAAVDIAAGDAADGGGVGARWVVLSATYGVIEIAAVAALPTLAPGASRVGLDPSAVVAHLLDAVLSQAAAITAAGGNLLPLVSGLGRRLGALGAVDSASGQSSLSLYSTQLLDLLPKQWTAGSAATVVAGGAVGGGGGMPLTVAEQLSYKEFRHSLLMQCLALSNVLHRLEPEVLRVLMENSEKLAVVTALNRLQAHQRDTHVAGQGGGQEAAAEGAAGGQWSDGVGCRGAVAAAALLSRLVAEAGQESSAREYEVLSPSEIFYARPSASVGRFLGVLGRAAAAISTQAARGLGDPGDSALASLRASVRELGSLVSVVVSAALGRREQLNAAYYLNCLDMAARLGRPDWLAEEDSRVALEQLATAARVVRPAPPAPLSLELSHTLYGLTDVLLTFFAAAVTAVTPRDPAARAVLLAAYRDVRSRLGRELLEDARAEMQAAGWGPDGGARTGSLPPDLLMCQLEGLFRAHHCYPQLFDVCEALAAAEPSLRTRLITHMATLPPEDPADPAAPTLAKYVFQRLLADGRPADLLELPHQFHAGITSFLQSLQPAAADLLAVQLVREGAWADAAAVLTQSAGAGAGQGGAPKQQQQPHPHLAARAGPVVGSLGPPRRLLSLARLTARVAGAADLEAHAARQLKLLGLQTRLGLGAEDGPLEPALVLDEALALAAAPARSETTAADDDGEAAASAKEAAVVAVEVLSLMPPEVRQAHVSKWQLAWKAVYDADTWDDIASARADSAGDQEWLAALRGTAVCRAAMACARSETLGFGANVVDSAPLDQVARWLRSWALAGPGAGALQAARNGTGGGGGSGGQGEALVERREVAAMSALRLGVEAQRGAVAEVRPAGGGAAGGLLDMAVD